MVQCFGHEKLTVYRKALEFAVIRSELLNGLPRRIAASGHLDRAGESILLNIAHASSSWSPRERIVSLEHANGSALECAACLDVFVAKALLTSQVVQSGKTFLVEIVSMLIGMRKTTANRVCEDRVLYRTALGRMFSHEDMDVYQTALRLTGWVERMSTAFSCSADLFSKLDSSTTSIVLNLAEGNGRFSRIDQTKFFAIAYKATVQSASLVDLATAKCSAETAKVEDGREMLRSIAAMIVSLSKAVSPDT